MIDNQSKLIPALVHKTLKNDFEINIYNFERNVHVNTFHPPKENQFDKIVHEVQRGEHPGAFLSSVYIVPKLKVERHSTKIQIRQLPVKRITYKTMVTLFRRFEFEPQPFVEIATIDENNNGCEESNNNQVIWKSTVEFEI